VEFAKSLASLSGVRRFDYAAEDAALKPQMNTDCTSVFICGFILCSLRNQKLGDSSRLSGKGCARGIRERRGSRAFAAGIAGLFRPGPLKSALHGGPECPRPLRHRRQRLWLRPCRLRQ